MIELKTCPFCGSAAGSVLNWDDIETWAQCTKRKPVRCPMSSTIIPIDEWNTRPTTQPTDAALQSATELAKAIWRDNYKATAPQWEPLPDLMGVLSQIDNMVCGMSRATDADKRDAVLERVEGDLLPPIGSKVLIHLARQGEWIEPCGALASVTEYNHPKGKQKGVFAWRWSTPATGPTRTMYGCKSGESVERGLLFNFCPFCGESVDIVRDGDKEAK